MTQPSISEFAKQQLHAIEDHLNKASPTECVLGLHVMQCKISFVYILGVFCNLSQKSERDQGSESGLASS